MAFDVEYVALVRALSDVQSICVAKRIYHQEVLQRDESFDAYPCIAYAVLNDVGIYDLNGVSQGFRQATFVFHCFSRKTEETRTLATAVQSIVGIQDADSGTLEFIEMVDTSDDFDPPIDMDARGMKSTQVTTLVTYRE